MRKGLPLWLTAIRDAKRKAWETLPPEERQRAVESQRDLPRQRSEKRAPKQEADTEKMRRIVE